MSFFKWDFHFLVFLNGLLWLVFKHKIMNFRFGTQSKFYTFFQSPKIVRKPIEEIFFNIQYNISNNQLTINSLKIDNKKVDGANITSLNNINDKQDLEIVNFIEFKKLLNKAFANYDG